MNAPSDASSLLIAAALLRQGRVINLASCAFTLAALLGALASDARGAALILLLGAIVLGAAQLYLAVRVGFDAALFETLARTAANQEPDLDAFDRAMVALALMPAAKTGRSVAARIAGARRLLTGQAIVAVCQLAVLMIAVVIARAP